MRDGASARPAAAGVTLRPAQANDEQAVGRLGALLVQQHHDYDPQRFIPALPDTAHGYGKYLASQITRPHTLVLVAERNGQVIGYAYGAVEGYDYMELRGPAGVLYDIVVDPAHRGAGVGTALLTEALALLTARGAPRVLLAAASRNETAQRLFTRAGFRQTMVEMTRESDAST